MVTNSPVSHLYIASAAARQHARHAADRVRKTRAPGAADLADARKYFGHLQAVAAHNLIVCFGRPSDAMTARRVNTEAANAYKRAGNVSPNNAAAWIAALECLLAEQHARLDPNW